MTKYEKNKCFTWLTTAVLFALLAFSSISAGELPEWIAVSTPWLTIPQDFNDDGAMPLQMRMTYEPGSADISAREWISSDPTVATIDKDGNVTLLKPGVTNISVRVGNVVSTTPNMRDYAAECVLTVLPLENRSMENRNLRHVPAIPGDEKRNNMEDFTKWPENYGDTVISLWSGNKIAVFTVSFDDTISDPYLPDWVMLHKKYGIYSSFCVDFPDKGRIFNSEKYFDFVNSGGEIINHGMRHLSGDTSRFTTADMLWELGSSTIAINKVLAEHADKFTAKQPRCVIFAPPGGNPLPPEHSSKYMDYIGKLFIGGRVNSLSVLPGHSPSNYASIRGGTRAHTVFADNEQPASQERMVQALLDPTPFPPVAYNYGGVGYIIVHGIYQWPMEFLFDNFLYPNKNQFSFATLGNMARYAQERDASEIIDKVITPDRIEFVMTDYLDDELFDYPLTIKVGLDATWNRLTATQDGKPIESRLVKNEGNVYAFVEAVPDRGKVVLTKAGEVKTYSNNATLASFEYLIDLVTPDMPGKLPPRIPVPNFNPDTLEYTVILPPGTKKVAFYGAAADDIATTQRNPLMGIVRFSTEGEPQTATLTVTAEDETVKVYRITFDVEPYSPVTKLAISTPDNLIQETISQHVDFTVEAEPADIHNPKSIEWYVDGEKHDLQGPAFRFTPLKYGTYKIQTKSRDVVSEERTVIFTKGAPKPIMIILDENFGRHAVGDPIPSSDEPGDNLFSIPNGPDGRMHVGWRHGEDGLKIVELPGRGKVAAWTTGEARWTTGLSKGFPNNATEPLVVSFKVRADNDEPRGVALFNLHFLTGNSRPMHGLFALAHNANWATFINTAGWRFGWDATSQKWISVVYSFDPAHRDHNNNNMIYEGIFVGNELYLGTHYTGLGTGEYMAFPGYNGRNTGQFRNPGTASFVFSFYGGPKDPANYGKYSTYLADVKIYRPGSLIMTPAKEAFAANESVRMNFSHHVNISTLKIDNMKVTDEAGAVVAIESITTDFMNSDYFVINFAPGTLKVGIYTVELNETVRDVLDKTAYDTATFVVR